jgi:predicted polyphosphate/ATP-dependent NAD kinase
MVLMAERKRVGLIINPIAGMGGRVGLKGTDGVDAAEKARALGAEPISPGRTRAALEVLLERAGRELVLLAAIGAMGEDVCHACGIEPVVIGEPAGSSTGPEDTRRAAREIIERGVDLLLFAGGDGTARNVCEAGGTSAPMLGIPTGVKMHSSVFASTPRAAGELAARFLTAENQRCRESEVMDIDEEAFRQGRVSGQLYGYLNVPYERSLLQGLKAGSTGGGSEYVGIAVDIAERMADGALWILGPGTTTRAIAERLGQRKTLLGVDCYSRGEVVAMDATEQGILRHLNDAPARVVVTPIGGQGFLFGRGNQQLSPEVIRRVGKANIVVVAASAKLAGLRGEPLRVDTGDPDLDRELAGYMRVVTGYHEESVQEVA